jgi:hypothetical protein
VLAVDSQSAGSTPTSSSAGCSTSLDYEGGPVMTALARSRVPRDAGVQGQRTGSLWRSALGL